MFNFDATKKNRLCTKDLKGSETILYNITVVDMCPYRFSAPRDYPRPRVNYNGNYEL